MEFIDLLQWPAMLVTAVSAWLVAAPGKRTRGLGFWCFLASNVLWIIWGWHSHAYALVVLQVVLAVMNIRGAENNEPATEGAGTEAGLNASRQVASDASSHLASHTTPADAPAADALGSMPSTSSASYASHSVVLAAFDRFASRITRWAGSPAAFCLAVLSIVGWAVLGPAFHYSENWQLVINTATSLITFLMVFLIQQSQNKDSVALHLKLNELLAANREASNRMIGIEDLDAQDLRDVATFYVKLAERAKLAGPHKEAHSIDEEGMPAQAGPRPVAKPA